MKKMSFIVCLLCIAGTVFSQGQGMRIEKLKMDSLIRYGKLENGLTYYIRHNEMPKERAEFYIVHKVGSLQEEDNQRGLAHFLEHMAFNGSKNFPSKKGIQEYTESIGMRMGENLNAYTGFDETQYMLMNVPVIREGIVDSCLLILHDWSSFLLLEEDAIEKERGVIREEWRTTSTAQMRLWEQQLPKMFPDSKYGTRLPIGSIDVINNFKRDELVAYYKKWYRPDLQALVIVGDIDVDKVEEKIKKMFSDIPAPVDPAPRVPVLVPDNANPLASIATDKEMTNTQITIFNKHDKLPEILKGTIADIITGYTQNIISLIMLERFSDIVRQPNPPFVAANAFDENYFVSKTKDAWTSMAIVKPGELDRAISTLAAETERVKRFGFTEAEYERAKDEILKMYESMYKDRDKLENSTFAEDYISNFTDNEAIPGIEIEYELINQIAPNFPVEGINQYVKQIFEENKWHNLVISLTGPEKEGVTYPSENELLAMYLSATEDEIEQNEDEVISKILIPELPKPGKIVSEKEDPLFGGNTVYTLSNGVRVVVKKTDYKEDQIIMTATSPGGTSMFKDDKDIWNIKIVNTAAMLGGLGEFSENNLRKALAGKNVSCNTGLGLSNENFNGSASPSDLKTLFELIYLQFTGIRMDEDAYSSFEERYKSYLEGLQVSPQIVFSDTLTGVIFNNNPRNSRINVSDFENVDYHRMIEMYKERYSDASDFVFTFVGNVDKDSIRPLMEQYLATLPSINRKEKPNEKQVVPFQKGKIKKHFPLKMEIPKSTVGLTYSGNMPYNIKNVIITQLLNQILDLVYTEKVREQQSASYSIQTYVSLNPFPEGRTSIQIMFDTDPQKQNNIIEIVKSELERIAKEGPSQTDFEKSRSNLLKGRVEMMQKNDYWVDIIDAYYYRGFDAHTNYNKITESITTEDIKSFAKKFLGQGNEIEVVMYPAADTD